MNETHQDDVRMRSKRVVRGIYSYSYMKNRSFYYYIIFCTWYTTSNNSLLSLVVQLVPLQLLPDGNGSVDRENASHADALRLLLR